MSFALPANDPHADFADLYSAAMPSLADLYSSFDMVCAIVPALKARPIAIAIALILNLFTVVPQFAESVGGAMAEPPAIAPVFTLPHLT
jgi:hypothetical protein